MPFSNTTTKGGLIQSCERWTGLGDAAISGNATLLKIFAAGINESYDEVLPIIYSSDAKWQWDDSNHDDQPIATLDLESGRADYAFTTDEDGNSILELRSAFVKQPGGEWKKLAAVDAENDGDTDAIFSQNSTNTGTPTRYDKIGATVWLDPIPNYGQSAGIRFVFSRSQSYFASTDTTKTPGIPRLFHKLLALIASRDWLAIYKSENTVLLAEVKEQITNQKATLKEHMSKRSRDEKVVARPRVESSR